MRLAEKAAAAVQQAIAKPSGQVTRVASLAEALSAIKLDDGAAAKHLAELSRLNKDGKATLRGLAHDAAQDIKDHSHTDEAKAAPAPATVLAGGTHAAAREQATTRPAKAASTGKPKKPRGRRSKHSAKPTQLAQDANAPAASPAHTSAPSMVAHAGAMLSLINAPLTPEAVAAGTTLATFQQEGQALREYNQTAEANSEVTSMLAAGASKLFPVDDLSALFKGNLFDVGAGDKAMQTLLESTGTGMGSLASTLLQVKSNLGGVSKLLSIAETALLGLGLIGAFFPVILPIIASTKAVLTGASLGVSAAESIVGITLTALSGTMIQKAQRDHDPQMMQALATFHLQEANSAFNTTKTFAAKAKQTRTMRKAQASGWRALRKRSRPLARRAFALSNMVGKVKRGAGALQPSKFLSKKIEGALSHVAQHNKGSELSKSESGVIADTSGHLADSAAAVVTAATPSNASAAETSQSRSTMGQAANAAHANGYDWNGLLLAQHAGVQQEGPSMLGAVDEYLGRQRGIIHDAHATMWEMRSVGTFSRQIDANTVTMGGLSAAGQQFADEQAVGLSTVHASLDDLLCKQQSLGATAFGDTTLPDVAPGNWWQRIIQRITKRMAAIGEATLGRVKESVMEMIVRSCTGESMQTMRELAEAAKTGNVLAKDAGSEATEDQQRTLERCKQVAAFETETERELASSIFEAEDQITHAATVRAEMAASLETLPDSIANGQHYLQDLQTYLANGDASPDSKP